MSVNSIQLYVKPMSVYSIHLHVCKANWRSGWHRLQLIQTFCDSCQLTVHLDNIQRPAVWPSDYLAIWPSDTWLSDYLAYEAGMCGAELFPAGRGGARTKIRGAGRGGAGRGVHYWYEGFEALTGHVTSNLPCTCLICQKILDTWFHIFPSRYYLLIGNLREVP